MGARKIKRQDSDSLITRFATGRLFRLFAFGFLLIASGLLVYRLYLPTTLPFKKIQVYGSLQWVDREEFDSQMLQNIDGGFFSLDVYGLKQNLEALAWINSVSIRRVWPDVLQVIVTEQQPVALWNRKSIVNRDGELFMPATKQLPDEMVNITGPAAMYKSLVKHYQALSVMTQELGLRITDITVNDRRAMRLTLSNGVQLFMGRVRDTSDSSTEMARFVHAYKATLAPQIDRIQFVDLRYTNGVAVRWKQQLGLQDKNKSIDEKMNRVTRAG